MLKLEYSLGQELILSEPTTLSISPFHSYLKLNLKNVLEFGPHSG